MAETPDIPRPKKKSNQNMVVSVLSVGSALSVFNFSWKFHSDVEKIVASQISVLKPSHDEIREVCRELVKDEKDRAREREEELKQSIEYLARVSQRGK